MFNILSELQYYGAPNRLLDVIKSPLIALFFAVEKRNDCPGYVYIYSSKKEEEKFDTGHTVAIKSALNFISAGKINDFLNSCKKIIDNYTTDGSEKIQDVSIGDFESNTEISKFKEECIKINVFMELLNQRARVRERLKHPFKIYYDLIKAHIVIPSKN